METTMTTESSVHFYLNWAKERLDEMDAALASLEAKAGGLQSGLKVKSQEFIAGLKKQRDEFRALIDKQAKEGEAAWNHTKAELEVQWREFEARVGEYLDQFGKQVGQQQATFQGLADAQMKAWRAAALEFQAAAGRIAAERRAQFDARVKEMQTGAAEAEARLQKFRQAGEESWSALNGALADSRKAFDRANQAALDAFKHAGR
jgi:SMC interacting uncharacterized protein involved in chromosome segregation